jgi:hypothetical protein
LFLVIHLFYEGNLKILKQKGKKYLAQYNGVPLPKAGCCHGSQCCGWMWDARTKPPSSDISVAVVARG